MNEEYEDAHGIRWAQETREAENFFLSIVTTKQSVTTRHGVIYAVTIKGDMQGSDG